MRIGWIVMVVALVCGVAGQAAVAADPEAGRTKAAICASCHGADGVSVISSIPSLAGQPHGFLEWELVFFRSGRRPNPVMGPIASDLSDSDIRNLGAFFAALPPPAPLSGADPAPELTAAGAVLARQGRCAACHGDDFAGLQAAARLAGQHEDYLVKALQDFRSGARPSTGVGAMTEVAAPLSDEQIKALAHFFAYTH